MIGSVPRGVSMRPTDAICALACAVAALAACGGPSEVERPGPVAGWPVYGADLGGSRHSPLTQITPKNVGALEVAWTYHSGDILDGKTSLAPSAFQNTPILFGDSLYLCTDRKSVV